MSTEEGGVPSCISVVLLVLHLDGICRRVIDLGIGGFVFASAEFLLHRVVFLVLGMVLMTLAHTLSQSLVFYYGGAMTIGIFLVVLIILFQVNSSSVPCSLWSAINLITRDN